MTDIYEKNTVDFKKQLSSENITTEYLNSLSGRRFDSVVIAGMGGSGVIGEILKDNAESINLKVPVFVLKDNVLPKTYTKSPLFISVSFSGDTEETLNAFKSAIRKFGKKNIAAVTGGGKLKEESIKNKTAIASFDRGDLTPRQASGLMYYGVINILEAIFDVRIPRFELETIPKLRKAGMDISKKIEGNIIVYSLNNLYHLSLLWKNNFNETSKKAAFVNSYPEINHNEIEGFKNISGKWTVIFLDDFGKFNHKKEFLKKELKNKKIKSLDIKIPGKNIFEKTWNGIILSHFTSWSLAERSKENPVEVNTIKRLKKVH